MLEDETVYGQSSGRVRLCPRLQERGNHARRLHQLHGEARPMPEGPHGWPYRYDCLSHLGPDGREHGPVYASEVVGLSW